MKPYLIRTRIRDAAGFVWLFAILTTAALDPAIAADPWPGPIPDGLRERLDLEPFYQKYLDADALPVLGSAKVSDNALAEAAWIIRHMLAGRDDILRAMAGQNVRAVVMAKDEYTTDIPEHAHLRPKLYWDRRARGLGATPRNPVVSAGEENLLGFHRDPYPNENIFLHEFAHAIHETGLNKIDPTFDQRLRAAHASAKERGLWEGTYAATNHNEYWAEGVQSWFDDNAPPDALHNDVRTRAKLKEYDAGLAALCDEVFGDGPWRYVKPAARKPEDLKHLRDYDPKDLPRFRWRSTAVGKRAGVVIQTDFGDFDIELDHDASPAAVKNFLLIALDGGYHSGRFDRVAGGAAWAIANAQWKERWAKDLNLEEVPESAHMPTEGTVALVQEETLWTGFAIYVEEKIDAGSTTVIPIGRVTNGREVVRMIHSSLASEGATTKPVQIRRVIRKD